MWKMTSGLVTAIVLYMVVQPAIAQVYDMKDRSFTSDEVKRALAPPTADNPIGANAEGTTVPSARRTRGLGVISAGAVSAVAADATPRKLSMQLQFGFDSAELTDGARARLDAVGSALQSPDLLSGKFIISGHTDATGRYDYNLGLSKRRAEAVKNYLMAKHNVDPGRIVPVGKASDDLLDAADPTSPANRRVQLEALN